MKRSTAVFLCLFFCFLPFTVLAQVKNIYFLQQQDYPYLETEPLSYDQVVESLNGKLTLEKIDFNTFSEEIPNAATSLLIWPYGSAMSDDVWPAMFSYLENGGNLLVTGGRFFSRNVILENGEYKAGPWTNRFIEQLRIIDSEILPYEGVVKTEVNERFPFLDAKISSQNVDSAYSVLVMMSSYSFTDRNGSLSSKDGTWYNIVAGVNQEGLNTIPLISEINREQEQFAGGRWLLFNFKPVEDYWDSQEGQELLSTYIHYGMNQPMRVDVVPEYAFYNAGVNPKINIILDQLQNKEPLQASVEVIYENKIIQKEKATMAAGDKDFSFELKKKVKDGLYRVNLTLEQDGQPFLYTWNGFLVGELASMNSGESFGTNSHFLTRGGETFPVAGMTYMSSENHRFYFIDPNPAIWDADFKYMKESGINMIRTGIWTGHEYILDKEGNVNDKTMRAWDAFFMIAKKYDIPVQLNFYHMMPSVEGVDDPYTNPKAYEHQKKYILAFAERYKNNPDIIWDLINEPSYGKEGFTFGDAVPTGTATEQKEWDQWLRGRYENLEVIASNWNTTVDEILDDNELIKLPEQHMLQNRGLYTVEQKPTMAFDYNLFSQYAYNNWAREMKKIIRDTGSKQLVVTGMDEGGVMNRVFHDFIAEESDFSNLHNWWQMDDLLWDNIMAKSKDIPLLLQEVGNMRFEDMRGHRRMSETAIAHSLERKLGYSIGVEGAGYIPWIWNTNIYLFNQNEAFIGLHRGDGTAKKEVEVFNKLNDFIHQAWDYFSPAKDPEIAVVIPYSLQMTAYNQQAISATRGAIRTLHYFNRMPAISASEYHLSRFEENPKLAILPGAQVISEEGWDGLLDWVNNGTTLLVTGPIDRDPWFLPAARLQKVGFDYEIKPLLQHQAEIVIDRKEHQLSFYGNSAMQNLDYMDWQEDISELKIIEHGQGKIIVCAYPLESGNNPEALAALYEFAATNAGIEKSFSVDTDDPGILVRPMDYERARFYFVLSESNEEETIRIHDEALDMDYEVTVAPGRVKMLMISKEDGELVAEY